MTTRAGSSGASSASSAQPAAMPARPAGIARGTFGEASGNDRSSSTQIDQVATLPP